MTEFQESAEPVEANPQEIIEALDRVSDSDETDSALDSLAHGLMGTEPAPAPAEADKEEEKPAAEEEKPAKAKVKVGDEELDLDEVVSGYMKEKDYRQKTQALAEERRKIAAYDAHIRNLESDPNYVAHVKAYRAPQPEPPKPPEDPIEALKWEIKQEAKRELLEEFSPQIQQLQAKQGIEAVKAQVMRDPLFDDTQAAILNMVQNLPPAVRDLTYAKLDADPTAYMETYQDARKWVEAQKTITPEQAKIRAENLKRGMPKKDENTPEQAPPVARRDRAPLLESAGRTVPTSSEESSKVKRASEISKMLKQGQGIDDDTLFEYFDLKGITAKLS